MQKKNYFYNLIRTEHKENKDIDQFESPLNAWNEAKNTPTIKFHLHRMRPNPRKKQKIGSLGPDMSSYINTESDEKKDKTFNSFPEEKNKSETILKLLLINNENRRQSNLIPISKKK